VRARLAAGLILLLAVDSAAWAQNPASSPSVTISRSRFIPDQWSGLTISRQGLSVPHSVGNTSSGMKPTAS